MRPTFLVLLAWSCCIVGCANGRGGLLIDSTRVSANLERRFRFTGIDMDPLATPAHPNGANLDDGVSENEAVLIALWKNAAFLEMQAELGIARADLIQAGLLPNPDVVYFVPVSDKPFKYLFDFPIEALWLRPIRVRAAEAEVERVDLRVVQAGLDLIRDTRQAYSELLLAHHRNQVAQQLVEIRTRIARLAASRLEQGDISPQETSTALIDSYRAQQDAVRIAFDIDLAEQRLLNLLGSPRPSCRLRPDAVTFHFPQPPDLEPLIQEAVTTRPDAAAAAQALNGAAERFRLAQIGWMRFLGIMDATSGLNGHRPGPAIRATLPVFNWNHGAIARAQVECERTKRQQQTVANQIVFDVQQAYARYAQAEAEWRTLQNVVLPEIERTIQRTELGYREGNTGYVLVLQVSQQWVDSRFREAQLLADLRRAWSDLERGVGRSIEATPERSR